MPALTLFALFAFGFVLAALFADLLRDGAVRALRALRLLPPPVVRFDGLLDELHRLWPLDAAEHDGGAALAEAGPERATLRRAA